MMMSTGAIEEDQEQFYECDTAQASAEAVWGDVELLQEHERQQRRLSKLPLPLLLPRQSHYLHKANPEDIKLFRTLFGLLSRALMAACAVYDVASMREFARRFPDSFQGPEESKRRLLDFPISRPEVIKLLRVNYEEFHRKMPAESYSGAVEKFVGQEHLPGDLEEDDGCMLQIIDDSGDGLVYIIVVDEKRKEFRLSFRGTVSFQDVRTDLSTSMMWHRNPLFYRKDNIVPQGKFFGTHTGFTDYMFGKYEMIHEDLQKLWEKYKGYSLLATGHSMGGAIVTLFAFWSCLENRFPPDVSIACVAFGSPKCGNDEFVRAFQQIQLARNLHFLRVANHQDFVTTIPLNTLWTAWSLHDECYSHVGAEVRLYQYCDPELIPPLILKNRFWIALRNIAKNILERMVPWPIVHLIAKRFQPLKWHKLDQYIHRLERCKKTLTARRLSSLIGKVNTWVHQSFDEIDLPPTPSLSGTKSECKLE